MRSQKKLISKPDRLSIFSNLNPNVVLASINSLTFPFMLIDSTHTILMANLATAAYLKTEPGNIFNKQCPRLRKDKYCHECPLEAAIESGNHEEREVYDERNNKWYIARISPVPFATTDNHPIFISIVLDITEKKLSENNLVQEKNRSTILAASFLEVIQNMLETRDPAISRHQKNVSKLAIAIAGELGLDKETREGIRISALVHDIGKISVPSEILARPGKLSALEYSYVQKHPGFGRELIAPVSFPWPVGEIIYQHHERINGSGYPEKLTGNVIRIEAKIIAIAEVVDSMTTHQPYRPAFSIGEALIELKDHRGILYDPEVVDACVLLFKEKGFTFKEKTEAGAAGDQAGSRK